MIFGSVCSGIEAAGDKLRDTRAEIERMHKEIGRLPDDPWLSSALLSLERRKERLESAGHRIEDAQRAMKLLACVVAVAFWASVPAVADERSLPDASITPGAVNAQISETSFLAQCHTAGWTRAYRPPIHVTNALKKKQMRTLGGPAEDIHRYEEDHLVPLCLAGAPADERNLWPEPRDGFWSAEKKDALERKLCRLACDGRIPLADAQDAIATNWIQAYRVYVAPYRRGARDEWQRVEASAETGE